ncbi:PadR family transcriptional regulator [Isoptericola aurantiacus]|uniref:PadR family transcriptional regulator n=1 Tax=Isoptericola aurantiacus TaxID=3377839 RepID=UPI00383ABBD4
MKLTHLLLGLLAHRPHHGYDLMRWFDVEGKFLRSNLHHSQVYRELRAMESRGLVDSAIHPSNGRPDAKVYRITDAGHQELLSWVRSPYEPSSRYQDADFSARLMFTVPLDVRAALDVVETELTYRRKQVGENRSRQRGLPADGTLTDLDPARSEWVGEALHRQGMQAVDAWIEWLEQMRTEIRAMVDDPSTVADAEKEDQA